MLRRPYVNHIQPRRAFQQALINISPRLITIQAESGKGKSTYMGWAKRKCDDNNIPVTFIDLKVVGKRDIFFVLGLMRHLLRRFTFEKYDAEVTTYTHIKATSITLKDLHLESSIIGDIIAENPHQRQMLETRLTEAFLHDLDSICQNQIMVFLWDACEQASQEITDWLTAYFIIGTSDIPQLITVVSGQKIPLFESVYWYEKLESFELPSSLAWEDWLEYAEKSGALSKLNEETLHLYHRHHKGDPSIMCLVCDPLMVEEL